MRSAPPCTAPAFHNAYSAPAASEAKAICGPRYPAWQSSSVQSGGALDTSSVTVFHVRPLSADRLTKTLTALVGIASRAYAVQPKSTFPAGSTVAPPASDHPGKALGFTVTELNVCPVSCEAATKNSSSWLNPT